MIEFQNITKTYSSTGSGDVAAVQGLDLSVPKGEVHCLIGTSGCGKTTTLRMVNRLETPTQGRILLDGEDIAELDVFRLRRQIGYVIQHGGLFPHMTVQRNIGILCELEGWSSADTRDRVDDLLQLVGLPTREFADRYPGELSGGQRQRVSVARALALDPSYVLMDEPFGALDPITRAELHLEFQQLLERVDKTILLVTHDLSEAFKLGDRVSLMHEGSLVQTGTRDELTSSPKNAFVADFLSAYLAGHTAYLAGPAATERDDATS